jgi:CheY-like chemotaxis protein
VAKVLVVDDDPAVQTMIRLVLERAGHHVVVAGDGRTALAAFESDNFGSRTQASPAQDRNVASGR